jgi:hypothetical protein
VAWVDGVSRSAAEVMLTTPARHPLSATVGEIRDFFRDDHVHAALIVSPAGYLEARGSAPTRTFAPVPSARPTARRSAVRALIDLGD